MSADNWTTCPNCKAKQQKEARELEEKLNSAYGKVSKEEYQVLVERIRNPPERLGDNLREDWELGIWQGEFFVNYSAACTVCDWRYEFKFEDENPLEKK